jgi:molybdenum cofactor guanylyltransferase
MSSSSAIVLAGGRSSRMGTAKALLPFDGEPLIAHIVRTLQPHFSEVVIVAAPQQELPSLPARIVHDEVGYQGPVGGIFYGLQAAKGELAFVTSCDSAFVNTSLAEHLVAAADGFEVVVPRWEDRFQPLFAVYRKSVLPLLETQLARGELRPVYLFDKVPIRVVEPEEIRRFDPDGASFFNMNTPADYEAALGRWSARSNGAAVACTVELLGAAQMVAHAREVDLVLPKPATLADVFGALVARIPSLAGKVIHRDGASLMDGYTCNVNARQFVRNGSANVAHGDNIAILSADAGG